MAESAGPSSQYIKHQLDTNIAKKYKERLESIAKTLEHLKRITTAKTPRQKEQFKDALDEFNKISDLINTSYILKDNDTQEVGDVIDNFNHVNELFQDLTRKQSSTWYNLMHKITPKPMKTHIDPTRDAEKMITSIEMNELKKELHGIKERAKDIRQHPKETEQDITRFIADSESQLEGDGADQKKVEFYQIMEASGGLDKKTAHEKTIEILTKQGKEQYATGNLNKPINPAIDPQSIKMQKFGEALNIARARPIAIKDAPHYEHPSQKLKMALKNFNTV